MIAALIRYISYDRVEAYCADLSPKTPNKQVIKILREIGVNLTNQEIKSMNEFIHDRFDIIITTTSEAREASELLTGGTKIHKEINDPVHLYNDAIDCEIGYRELRDELNEWLNEFISRHRLVQI